MHILIADKTEQHGIDGLRALGAEVVYEPDTTPEALRDTIARVDPAVLIVRSTKVSADAIKAGPGLEGIIRAGAGYDTIDTAAAAERGVAVCNCPGMNAVAVAELVFALLLACDRRVVEQARDAKAGEWEKKKYAKAGRGLKGMTLGVIGVGAIGREVIDRARAFEMNVVAHSINMTRQRADDLHVGFGGSTREDMYEMLASCDAVSVHVAGNPQSESLCDRRFFEALKPGAIFVNTSRGSVQDQDAIAWGVREKDILVGLDVYRNEPSVGAGDWDYPYREYDNVVGTHHVGASTEQAQLAVADEVVRIVKVWNDTGGWENRVN